MVHNKEQKVPMNELTLSNSVQDLVPTGNWQKNTGQNPFQRCFCFKAKVSVSEPTGLDPDGYPDPQWRMRIWISEVKKEK